MKAIALTPLSFDERRLLRRKPWWSVSEFAAYMCITPKRALRSLLRYNVELGGLLLRPSEGANRRYTFFWAALAKHAPDGFLDDPLELQRRVDELEDQISTHYQAQRMIAHQTGQNTRDIQRLKRPRRAAA